MRFYDPLYGAIELNGPYAAIVNSPDFRRLHFLRQLGLCYLSFPGGNHTRFEHSLGAYHLACSIGRTIRGPDSFSLKQEDKDRLAHLLALGALCHDIGHGPFSHMTENTLHGLGIKATHEDIGAAIVRVRLAPFLQPLQNVGITADNVASILTHTPSDAIVRCAVELVSSDLDVDRLDYLFRDLHYSGVANPQGLRLDDLQTSWHLSRVGTNLYLELTEDGVHFAERILLLRRDNYRRIVFESRHMAATAMFEKAVLAAANQSNELKQLVSALKNVDVAAAAPEALLTAAMPIYGLTDHEALRLLYDGGNDARYLVRQIRAGAAFPAMSRISWQSLHYLAKQRIAQISTPASAFRFRRVLETRLAAAVGESDLHVVVSLEKLSPPRPLMVGVYTGGTLGDASVIGSFFADDYYRQYAVELFIDEHVTVVKRNAIREYWDRLLLGGELMDVE